MPRIAVIQDGTETVRQRFADVVRVYEECAEQLRVPYLGLARTLMEDDRWGCDVAGSDGCHPGEVGYDLVAQRVLAWPAWWFGS